MILGICIATLMIIIGIILAVKGNPMWVILGLVAVIALTVIMDIENDLPSYSQASYGTRVGFDCIRFKEYVIQGQTVQIPSHYYLKKDWINHWVYCDSNLIIDCPANDCQSYIYKLPASAPYVSQGTIECR